MTIGVVKMSGRSSSAAVLLAMMMVMMTMFITKTDCFSINQTITVSSTWCDGLDDLSCLIGQTDLDSDEFMLDSEFSRRILATGQGSYSGKALNAGTAVSCDRKGFPPCHTSEKNKKPIPEHCKEEPTNKGCYHYN